jgi:hypothetical protein
MQTGRLQPDIPEKNFKAHRASFSAGKPYLPALF